MKTIASHNGLQAAAHAWQCLRQGAGPLDACVDGVTLVEDDPDELTVGYGGLPNEDGEVELDAAVMDGATHRGGGVAGLKRVRHAAQVARLVMQQTNRVLLVGEGALKFARANGFAEEELLTDRARRMWLYWKRRRSNRDDWLTPEEDEQLDLDKWYRKHFFSEHGPEKSGTVHCAAVDGQADLACVTSTSGHAFKMAGRVGDSPILGAGLYVDNAWGSCGSIGHGEANLASLSSAMAVEQMRLGQTPQQAGLEVLRRVADRCPQRDRDSQGRPRFHVQLFVLSKDGQSAGVSLWPGRRIAVCDDHGPRLEPCTPLFHDESCES